MRRMTKNKSYVEHAAIRVRDIHWHIRFFRDVLGMDMREIDGPPEAPHQYWTLGGMQFISTPDFIATNACHTCALGHLGIMVQDLELALTDAQSWGVKALPQGRNWLQLPEGVVLELIQAHGDGIAQALAVKSRP
jgi:catechol 2,3-dioxygenase-like lactoylglutathione lyase family enzyme